MIPLVPQTRMTGFWKGVRVRAQQSKGRARVEEEFRALPLRIWELRRCSIEDWYCFSFCRFTIGAELCVTCRAVELQLRYKVQVR